VTPEMGPLLRTLHKTVARRHPLPVVVPWRLQTQRVPSPSVADNVALVEGAQKKRGVPIPYGSHPRNLIWAPICNFPQSAASAQ
jgi:hypothetical protein